MTAESREALVLRGKRLEYVTVGYNLLEGIIAITAGLLAGSIALVGFGIDSAIEVSASLLLIWRLHMDVDASRREKIEKRSLQLVGITFLLLAAYVGWESAGSLIAREAPKESVVGIVLAAVSVIVMPLLVRAKRRVADAISSRAMHAEATQTQLCTYLSAILLVGLGLNALFGWWWADPVAAAVMVPIIAREGFEALRGEECSCHGDSCAADESA